MKVECTYGPVSTEVMGTVYNFVPDEDGRNVAEVWNPKHLQALLAVVHYRRVDQEGEAVPAPTLTGISPESAAIGDPDLTLVCTGTGFLTGAVIIFNGGEEATEVISDTSVSTIVKPSLAGTPGAYTVSVRNGDGQETDQLEFEFTAAPAPEEDPEVESEFVPLGNDSVDDRGDIAVTDISGIGPAMAEKLASIDVIDARQIAAWSPEEAAEIDAQLGLGGRIARDGWIEQAKALTA